MAAKAYWLARALGERGHEIHIITDAVNPDDPYHIQAPPVEECHPRVLIHRASSEVPWIIPHERHSSLSLLDKSLEVIENIQPNVICAAYLVPYGLVGCLASSRTGVPLVLQHGGSDINKFLAPGVWNNLWTSYLEQASTILTDVDHHSYFSSRSLPIKIIPPYVPNPSVFTSKSRERNRRPRLALIGKANYYWKHKGWHRVIDIWLTLHEQCDFLIVGQGLGFDSFRKYVQNKLGTGVNWRNFIHPSEMSNLLHYIDYLFFFEEDLPYKAFSNLPLEAIHCGVKLVTDGHNLLETYSNHGLDTKILSNFILNVTSETKGNYAQMILNDLLVPQPSLAISHQDFTNYIYINEDTLLAATKKAL